MSQRDELEDQGELAIPQVAQSEHDLLMLARALVAGPDSRDDIWSLLCATRQVAPKIGPTCANLLEDTLRQVWRSLWQRGGTQPRASYPLDGRGPVRGRLWERYQPVELAFSSATLQLLRWLVQTPFAAPASTYAKLPATKLTVGDQVMVYFALDAARATPALQAIAAQPFVQAAPLAWLGFATYLAAGEHGVPAFDSLTEGAGPIVIEALSGELARRWQASELAKRSITNPAELIELGEAQDAVLTGWFDACDRSRRRDLAGFVLDAIAPLIEREVSPSPLELEPGAPLSVRARARTSAGSLLRAVTRWHAWDQQHRGVRFIDDDYAVAQLLLARFERIGSAGIARVNGWLADLASLAPLPPSDTVSSSEGNRIS
ncbi:MAG: hypothetical protein H6Q90_4305 [Deltaproteobacteria bacterium]|nr:hypothetical protein [Deltaproteobacteria bacterium]